VFTTLAVAVEFATTFIVFWLLFYWILFVDVVGGGGVWALIGVGALAGTGPATCGEIFIVGTWP
jgi:hypothetical protein